MGRPEIAEVFTPRNVDINEKIYVERSRLEGDIRNALRGTTHILIYGDSGNGKTWLYRKVLKDINAYFQVANCANAVRLGSLTEEIYDASVGDESIMLDNIKEQKSAQVKAFVAGGELKSERSYVVKQKEMLFHAFENIRRLAGDNKAVLVLDNLETINSSSELMAELGNILILLDDARYSKFDVRILLVGVPAGVLEYFSNVANLPTIANRVRELEEVTPLDKFQTYALIEKGFIDLLNIDIDRNVFEEWKTHIYDVTLGIPQRVHEYCEQLAYVLEDNNWSEYLLLLEEVDRGWLNISLRHAEGKVSRILNGDGATYGRRNQVLYALSKIQGREFQVKDVEKNLKNYFIGFASKIPFRVSDELRWLAKQEFPILKKIPGSKAYCFTDPRYIMVLRVLLYKADDSDFIMRANV